MVENITAKRSQIRTLLNTDCFGYRPRGVKELAADVIRVNCSIDRRYANFDISKFLSKNADKDIASLILTLTALERYGYELLKNGVARRTDWREISLESSHYQKKISGIEGAEEILKMFGYVNKDKDRLSYSEYINEPVREAVLSILIDIIVANEELDSYHLKSHPHSKSLESILGKRDGQQGLSPRSTRDISMISSKIMSSQSFRIQPSKPPRKPVSTFDMQYQTIDSWNIPPCNLCGDSKGIVNCKDCACSHCAECDKEWHLHPKRKNHTNRITSRESRGGNEECNIPMSTPVGNLVQRSISLRPTVQSESWLISRSHLNGSDVKIPKSDTHLTTVTRQLHKVPTIDTSIEDVVSKLSNDRKIVEDRLRIVDKLLLSYGRGSRSYAKYEAEQDALRQHLNEIKTKLRDIAVTEQPRATASKMKYKDVTINAMEVAVDHSLNISDVTKNIRRPPTDDAVPYKGHAYHKCEHQRNKDICVYCHGDLNKEISPKGKELARQEPLNYPEVRDKDLPLVIIESHFSNDHDTPAPVGWECPHCTYINKKIDIFICEMCSKTTLKEQRK